MRLSRRGFIGTTALSGGAALLPAELLARTTASAPPPVDLRDWDAVRRLFELSPDYVHAALFLLSSHPRPVREAVDEMRRALDANPADVLEEGAFGPPEHNLDLRATAAVARYIGASADDVALVNSTTHGLAVAYQGLSLGPGDEILNTAHDHVVHLETVRLVSERCGASARQVRLFEGHDASAATTDPLVRTLRNAISPATRVLGVTWVHSSSGLKLPIRPLAEALREVNEHREPGRRVTLLVDGVHGLGADDPRVAETGIDVFVSGLHKWMLAPRGTGIVWARPELWARMRPINFSYNAEDLYVAWIEGRPPRPPARASWFGLGGFQAYEHIWAIPAAVEMHEAMGPARVKERILTLNGTVREELSKMPHVRLRTPRDPELSAGITAFEVEGLSPHEVVKKLRTHRVIASVSPYRPTYARLSFGIANSEADVDRAVAAVRALR
ncbi:MAG TPA: aminotransferase class V-fold PLP-dependent enzyme [Vicinamibacteria bacterium]|nr:aminotransferase class V-fold PLP-dependent enzyme [Vicinamibacteria bacterium]